jgi:outer membrane protein OmpA-like peptidoglycan-associated protein
MKVFLPGILLFACYSLFARWYFVCEIQQLCVTEPVDIRLKNMQLTKADEVLLDAYDEFKFLEAEMLLNLNENNIKFLDSVVYYADLYPESNLKITGYYLESEKEMWSGIFENLGIARAAVTETLLEEKGMDLSRVVLDYELNTDSMLFQPFKLELTEAESYEELQFTFTDMTFSDANFEYNSAVFKPGDAFKFYADSLVTYFSIDSFARLDIIGHTDSVGSDAYNTNLGAERASSAKEFLIELGLNSDKIQTSSKGKTQPVAPNTLSDGSDNEAGRQRNRRVNFVIKTQE